MLKGIIIGHLGRDCVVNTVNGKNVINFTVAHSDKWKDSRGDTHERTHWVDCAYWTDRTAISPYLKKGTKVFVEGPIEAKMFTRQDGTNGVSLAVKVMQIELLSKASDTASNSSGSSQAAYGDYGPAVNSSAPIDGSQITEPIDDLPF